MPKECSYEEYQKVKKELEELKKKFTEITHPPFQFTSMSGDKVKDAILKSLPPEVQKEYIVEDAVPRPNNYVPGEFDWIIILKKRGFLRNIESSCIEGKGIASESKPQ